MNVSGRKGKGRLGVLDAAKGIAQTEQESVRNPCKVKDAIVQGSLKLSNSYEQKCIESPMCDLSAMMNGRDQADESPYSKRTGGKITPADAQNFRSGFQTERQSRP